MRPALPSALLLSLIATACTPTSTTPSTPSARSAAADATPASLPGPPDVPGQPAPTEDAAPSPDDAGPPATADDATPGPDPTDGAGPAAAADAAITAPDVPPANHPPQLDLPALWELAEEQDFEAPLPASDPDGDALRVTVAGLPPGALHDAAAEVVRFRPDFTQGGASWTVTVTVSDGEHEVAHPVTLEVVDTESPPAPTIAATTPVEGGTAYEIDQLTDAFLDSPGHAGRVIVGRVTVPHGASATDMRAVGVGLHGFSGGPAQANTGGDFIIRPFDPENTYWWGYAETLPGAAPAGAVPPYTARRVLHLLDWVLKTFPGADPERVYLAGGSMGGAGAKTIGMLYARHFCYVEATIGQAIPRNHRPTRVAQLATLWGAPGAELTGPWGGPVWDEMDLTRALLTSPEARDQFVFTRHGKDDPIIHFGAMVWASPATNVSFYDALQDARAGHYVVWDEGGHGPEDPVLGAYWSDWGWNRVHDDVTFLRRDLAFPAFSRASHDDDPGDGTGTGSVPLDPEAAYAGDLDTPGDTGWSGDLAGALNRFLRWDAALIVDEVDLFEIPLRVLDADGEPSPAPGYPTKGNLYGGPFPILVDVTPRRTQAFRPAPGEVVTWSTDVGLGGTVVADATGSVTIEQLPLDTAWTTLVLER